MRVVTIGYANSQGWLVSASGKTVAEARLLLKQRIQEIGMTIATLHKVAKYQVQW